jgi:hypothetical protein
MLHPRMTTPTNNYSSMRIELRLPDDSDSNQAAEYRWMWAAGPGVSVVGTLQDFVEAGVRRYSFDFEDQGELTFALRNIFPPSLRHGPSIRARIVIEVDESGSLPE